MSPVKLWPSIHRRMSIYSHAFTIRGLSTGSEYPYSLSPHSKSMQVQPKLPMKHSSPLCPTAHVKCLILLVPVYFCLSVHPLRRVCASLGPGTGLGGWQQLCLILLGTASVATWVIQSACSLPSSTRQIELFPHFHTERGMWAWCALMWMDTYAAWTHIKTLTDLL